MVANECESEEYGKENEEGQEFPVRFVSWVCNWMKACGGAKMNKGRT